MARLVQDIRHALRRLRKSPGFTALAVLTLALGIGANTAAFSMVNALLLHPYDFPELDRLVLLWENRGLEEGVDARFIAAPDARDLLSSTRVFEELALFRCHDYNLSVDGSAQPARGCGVSAGFFNLLGARPASGRTFTEAEDQPGANQAAVISYGFWQRRFGGDASILGKLILMNGGKYNVIGVMPRGFDYPVPMEVWVPLALTPEEKADRSKMSFRALGRLKAGVSLAQARKAIDSVSLRLQKEYPAANANRRAELLPLRKELYAYTLPLFLLLQAAAGFVLLLASANLGNLLFARILGRQKEIAVRSALGESRWQLVRLLVTETLLLASIGGVVAAVVSFWSVKVLRTSISPGWTMWVPGWDGIRVNASVLAFTLLLAAVLGVLFGAGAAWYSRNEGMLTTLKEAGAGPVIGGQGRLRNGLVVAQVTLALVLLVCAGLTAQAFLRLVGVYRGFEAGHVLRAEIRLPENLYQGEAKVAGFYERLLRASSSLPGTTAASLVTNSPASNVDNEMTFLLINGRSQLKSGEEPSADLQISSPDYFRALRIPLVAGRFYSEADNLNSARVVVISRSMATRFWPRGDELGQQIKLGKADSSGPWMTIIGVVEDVRQNWWNPAARPTIYQPFFQAPQSSMVLLLRVSSNPKDYVSAVRDLLRSIDDQVALTEVGPLDREIEDSIAIIRILGVLMALFGCVALVLASVGVFGLLAENVARRVREIGIRLALGAHPRDVVRLVLEQAVKLTGLGLIVGVPVAFLVNRAMSSLIFGIVSINLPLLIGLTALLIFVALLAAYLPARRAAKVDPIAALRYE